VSAGAAETEAVAQVRGYFGIGVEGISKPMNLGNLVRSAHAFGAGFAFTIGADPRSFGAKSDTSASPDSMPVYRYDRVDDLELPEGCTLVGVELLDSAIELPSFRHPRRAAYVLGPERGQLSDALRARCRFVVRIPTRFCINLATAGAVLMYDRMLSLGKFAERPVTPHGGSVPHPNHVFGAPRQRTRDSGAP
jgi:tRNA G18 (ribose-2'-O)-methylase SpoU